MAHQPGGGGETGGSWAANQPASTSGGTLDCRGRKGGGAAGDRSWGWGGGEMEEKQVSGENRVETMKLGGGEEGRRRRGGEEAAHVFKHGSP